jgi:hypothetical protein
MAKDKLSDYDGVTASNNTDIGGVSIAEGMLPSNVNNSMRELTKQLGAFADGTDGVDVLKLQDDTDTNSIKLQAPASVTADTTFTMPDGDGSSDQVLKTDGSGQLGWADRHANPSLIINGAFTVAQRGTSATVTTGSAPLTVDRFSTNIANLDQASLTESQDSAVPSGQGFANSFKVVVGGTAETTLDGDETVYIRYQGIEGQDAQHLAFGTSSAKKTTLSFWVRSGVTGNYAVLMYTNNGIGGASPRSQTLTYTVNSADTWEYKTITFDGDGASGNALANDTSAELQLYFSLAAGSNSTATDGTSWGAYAQGKLAYGQTANLIGTASAAFYITGVKLEVGSTATDFVHRSFGEELALCQRYYEVTGILLVTNLATMGFPAPTYMVEKRATPNSFSLTIGAGSGGNVAAQSPSTKAGFYQSTVNSLHTNCEVRVDAEL